MGPFDPRLQFYLEIILCKNFRFQQPNKMLTNNFIITKESQVNSASWKAFRYEKLSKSQPRTSIHKIPRTSTWGKPHFLCLLFIFRFGMPKYHKKILQKKTSQTNNILVRIEKQKRAGVRTGEIAWYGIFGINLLNC